MQCARATLALAAIALLGGGCSKAPTTKACTSCPNVAGDYTETITSEPASDSSCGQLFADGFSDTVTVNQPGQGSTIQLMPSGFTGTLNSDLSVTLDQIAANTAEGDPGELGLAGTFQIQGGAVTGFQGQYNFFLNSNNCGISAPTAWSKQ